MEYNLDRPINNASQDLLGRAAFAEKIAEGILKISENNESAVVGIQGEWGSGKTSVVRMIENSLGEKVNIVRMETWLTLDRESLVKEFFSCILNAIASDGKLHICYEDMKNYANQFSRKFLRAWTVNVGNQTTGAMFDMAKLIDEPQPQTLESRKNAINKTLADKDVKPIVFFIDDIDRLSYNEISILFQMVKNIADFKKIIYVLCYDKNIVGNALDNVHKGRGYEYIEKVVQIPIDIPMPNNSLIKRYFISMLESLLNETDYIPLQFDRKHWENIFLDSISKRLNTIRDCNRLYNSFSFKFKLFGSECDFADLMAITFLELEAPQIVDILKVNKNTLLCFDGLMFVEDEKICELLWNKIANAIDWNDKTVLKDIISHI